MAGEPGLLVRLHARISLRPATARAVSGGWIAPVRELLSTQGVARKAGLVLFTVRLHSGYQEVAGSSSGRPAHHAGDEPAAPSQEGS